MTRSVPGVEFAVGSGIEDWKWTQCLGPPDLKGARISWYPIFVFCSPSKGNRISQPKNKRERRAPVAGGSSGQMPMGPWRIIPGHRGRSGRMPLVAGAGISLAECWWPVGRSHLTSLEVGVRAVDQESRIKNQVSNLAGS